MRTDIRHTRSADDVRINHVLGGERSRSLVNKDRNLTRCVREKLGKVLTTGKE